MSLYLQVSTIFNHFYYRAAKSPEGPWSREGPLYDASGAGGTAYFGALHPEYASANGRTQYVTYYYDSGVDGEYRVHKILKVQF